MKKKILSLISIFALLGAIIPTNINIANANSVSLSFNKLRDSDIGTFNEYGYKITKLYTSLDEYYKLNFVINSDITKQLLDLVEKGYKYLPDSLENESKYRDAKVALKLGLKYPNNDTYFEKIRKSLENFIEHPNIQQLKGKIIATPNEGNAPLITTFRAEVEDPSGSTISKRAYTWSMIIGGKKTIIGNRASISHTFNQEGTFYVFLDVKSSHKNKNGYIDVLPYHGKVQIKVKEKIASVILRISGKSLDYDNQIKISPENASYGLIFDATSSVPASGTKIIKTTWDFGNGVKKSYSGNPKIERIIYSREGDYEGYLELKTNQGKTIKQKFKLLIHKPIASIKVNKTQGYIDDKFMFSATSYGNSKFLSYSWSIIDTKKDKVITKKLGKNFSYSFKEKGEYSVKLIIKDAAGNMDVDTETIYINSRPPVANIQTSIPYSNQPSKVYLDATSSYDPDYGDDGKLRFSWTIDGEDVNLEEANDNGSNGFYKFTSIGDHSIILKVEDDDGLTDIKKTSIKIKSILDLDFSIYPRVAQRNKVVRFIAESKNAKFYTWDFGDGEIKSTKSSKISHSYKKSGIFPVKLTVSGKGTDKNSYTKNVYIGDSENPVAVINLKRQIGFDFKKEKNACHNKEAYIVSRKDNLIFSGKDSIDVNGLNTGLSYSWLIGKNKYKSGMSINERFDELGCKRVKLTVKSNKEKTTNSTEIWLKVINLPPTISGLKISPVDLKTDPVIVKVTALQAKDSDGVIQSYLWYYTTDIDNEAQDFRITKTPDTTFVIPKIQGTYYFGLIMKDNNGAKVNTEDLVNKIGNNFIELQGDNTNTPLIDFSVSDSSVGIGEEVTFRAIAKNIRGDSINSTATFDWDFDGDGFYEIRKSKKSTITHKYKKSGTFYPKVKVTNKGFSNTRTLTINVHNKLKADFDYISIGNKFIIVNKSKGTIEKNSWDLGDGTKEENKEKIIYKYKDHKSTHEVELVVSEGTKVKKTKKEITKNIRNILKVRKKGIHIFSFPPINKDGEIILKDENDVFIYLGESKGDFKYYGIDYDINIDTNQNGGNDDDIDNQQNESFIKGSPDKIALNESKEQTVRVFVLDKNKKVVDSKDIKIIKEYIKNEGNIKIGEFKNITIEEKAQIEELKIELSKLPQEHRLKAMKYLQKLQEDWQDKTEKIRTIITFEKFIIEINAKNKDKITKILDSFITKNTDDQKELAYQALVALIPESIKCNNQENCKNILVSKLSEIKQSNNIEENLKTGKEIGKVIAKSKLMTKEDKIDFKGILRQLIYSGTTNIPKKEIDEQKKVDQQKPSVQQETGPTKTQGKSLITKILIWVAIGFGIIIAILFLIWLINSLKNRKSDEEESNDTIENDILGDLEDPLEQDKKEIKDPLQTKESAIFSPKLNLSENKEKKEEVSFNNLEKKQNNNKKDNQETQEVPDWLSGSLNSDDNSEKNKDSEKEEENLGFSLDIPEEEKQDDKKDLENNDSSENLEKDSSDDDEEIPDWLNDNSDEESNKQEEDSDLDTDKKEENSSDLENNDSSENLEKDSSDDDEEIPDWLNDDSDKESNKQEEDSDLDTDKKEENSTDLENNDSSENLEKNSSDDNEENSDGLNDNSDEESDKQEENSNLDTDKKEENSSDLENNDSNENLEKNSSDEDEENSIKNEKLNLETNDELFDDDLFEKDNTPDWLKESLVEKIPKKSNKQEDNINTKPKLDEEDIPDWLIESVKETKIDKKETAKKTSKTKRKTNKKDEKETKKDDELWNDGMDIPDWLKTD